MEEQNYPGRPRKYDDKVIWEKYDEFVAKYKKTWGVQTWISTKLDISYAARGRALRTHFFQCCRGWSLLYVELYPERGPTFDINLGLRNLPYIGFPNDSSSLDVVARQS